MTTPEQAVVVVSAVGTASAAPDAVVVSLTLEVVADEPGPAVGRVAALLDEVLAVLGAHGVVPGDRRTAGLQVGPHWDPRGEGPQGHHAQYALEVVAGDVPSAGALVQRLAETAGEALRVQGFALTVRDPQPHLALARAEAVRACHLQAEQLAEAAGSRLGRLLRLEQGARQQEPGLRVQALTAAGPAVEPGTQDLGVAVTATYALEAETD